MTDFTKEELEFLANELGVWGNDYEGCHEESEKLLKKIQLMIDGYKEKSKCQHKEIITGAYPRSNPPKKCDLCGVLYRE